MADLSIHAAMLTTLLSLTFLLPAAQNPSSTTPSAADAEVQHLLEQPVLQQGEQVFSAQMVLEKLYPLAPNLRTALESNAEYLRFYLDSIQFYNQVRWFSNLLILDSAGIPEVDHTLLQAEALTWSRDRGGDGDYADAILARGGFEILCRARLMALQPAEFSMREIRTHFNRSVPEFFGRLKVSWIRLPLFDMDTNRAVGEEERLARYALLDEVAHKLQTEAISWEEAVEKYCEDPVTSKQDGRVGYIKRTDHRFDEEFLRQLFVDFGVTLPQSALLRGPISGTRWVYLARVEKVFTEGVVDLQLVRDRVIRSLRVYLFYEKLHSLAKDVARHILLPIRDA